MAPRTKQGEDGEPKRLNRAVGVGELAGKIVGPALRTRGFASRDIITHWGAMAPPPYDRVAVPDKLAWPRGARGAEGATLYLRCLAGHGLMLSHEAPQIAKAVNRYFGYVLVNEVRLSAEPLSPPPPPPAPLPPPTETVKQSVGNSVGVIEDEGVREALRRLGHAVVGKR